MLRIHISGDSITSQYLKHHYTLLQFMYSNIHIYIHTNILQLYYIKSIFSEYCSYYLLLTYYYEYIQL